MKPAYRISWPGNLQLLSDFTFGPSLKVKQWFTSFGELSFWWIQICICSLMCGSSFYGYCHFYLKYTCIFFADLSFVFVWYKHD